MARKEDIRQVRDVAAEFGLNESARHDFGDYLHELKEDGERGSKPNGDFTYEELRAHAREFVRLTADRAMRD
jgi:hypothetical protein